jgi:peptidoglycan L-alanyl-D-glutamate endopeptidase CwlK
MDDRSRKTLSTVHPEAHPKFEAFMVAAQALAAARGLQYIAICGLRSWAEQEALYAKGRTAPGPIVTKAPPGSSFHNFGLAIDCGVFRGKAYLDEKDPKLASAMHRSAGALAKVHGLRWGGDFKSIVDMPHYELDTRLSLAQLREGYNGKGWVSLTA